MLCFDCHGCSARVLPPSCSLRLHHPRLVLAMSSRILFQRFATLLLNARMKVSGVQFTCARWAKEKHWAEAEAVLASKKLNATLKANKDAVWNRFRSRTGANPCTSSQLQRLADLFLAYDKDPGDPKAASLTSLAEHLPKFSLKLRSLTSQGARARPKCSRAQKGQFLRLASKHRANSKEAARDGHQETLRACPTHEKTYCGWTKSISHHLRKPGM